MINMKTILLLVLLCTFASCTTDEIEITKPIPQRVISVTNFNPNVLPVYQLNGLHNKKSGKEYVNLQWYTDYDFPTFQPYYNTIRRNGVIVGDNYTETFNRFGMRVENGFGGAWFSVTQTVIGVGTSQETFFYVPDMVRNNREVWFSIMRDANGK
jgi:hypothetical protein